MTSDPYENDGRGVAILRWGLAGLCVVAAHAGAGWWIVTHAVTAAPPATVQGIPIDLEPVAAPENAPQPSASTTGGAAPAPQAAAAPAEPPPDPVPTPASAEPPPPAPEPPPPDVAAAQPIPAEPAPPPPAAEIPPMPDALPDVAAAPVPEMQATVSPEPPPVVLPEQNTTSDAVLAPPAPSKPMPAKPDPRVLAREAARRKALAEKRAQQRAERVQARAQAKAVALARTDKTREAGGQGPEQAAPSGVSAGAALATWRGAVQAHLRGFTPSGNGSSGTARVAFSVDRSGRVVSANLAGSSGDPGLDAAAVAMVRRASPVPAPPPELGARIGVTVPVHFQ